MAEQYLKFSTPHKLSMYLSQGLPVIVWKESAMANFVEENNIGFTIQSLSEIDEIFEKITAQVYADIKSNVQIIKKKVVHGEFLKTALSKCFSKLNIPELREAIK